MNFKQQKYGIAQNKDASLHLTRQNVSAEQFRKMIKFSDNFLFHEHCLQMTETNLIGDCQRKIIQLNGCNFQQD